MNNVSPQEPKRQELENLADREARAMLGVSLTEAFEMLDKGELAGTGAEAELRSFRFLLSR